MQREPIAIVGVAALFPGSTSMGGFWRDILTGRDLLTDVPAHYWLVEDYYDPDPAAPDKTYGRRGAFLSPVEFDAVEFGIPPAALSAVDCSQLLGLIAAKQVLADAAGGRKEHVRRDRIGVFLGIAGTTSAAMNMAARLQRPAWIMGMRESGIPESQVQAACERIAACFSPLQENTFPGVLGNVVAGRIANRFDLGGGNFTTDAACASSLAAVSVAINELYLHSCDMVITGGVDALNDVPMFMCFSKTPALSPTEDCRPFSDHADGTMLGEGLAMFALRRLSDAERDGDQIYAVISGLGSSSDGLAKSVYAPRPAGQVSALKRAYAQSGFAPRTIELVEAHGTGTAAGDQAEFEALCAVFGDAGIEELQWCALGSVKSQIGHTKGAAGAAGLFKATMALHHKVLPPTIKVDRPNPQLRIEESPFYLNTEARPWVRNASHPRRAAVSSFGFGGTNFHLTLEEYSGQGRRPPRLLQSPVELFVLSASNAAALAARCRAIPREWTNPSGWRRFARESQKIFDSAVSSRLAVVASSEDDLRQKLDHAAQQLEAAPGHAIHDPAGIHYEPGSATGSLAFLFAGQGSQYVAMGKDVAMTFNTASDTWDFAEEVLCSAGLSLRDIVFPKAAFDAAARQQQADLLMRTEYAQPALAAVGLAHLAIMRIIDIEPCFAAGHSFGELVALCAAGCFSHRDLLLIARRRGALMASLKDDGTMTAVSHPVADLERLLEQWGSAGVTIANRNAPAQAVLAGDLQNIVAIEQRLSAESIAFRRLPVGAAFHSPLIAPSMQPFSDFLNNIEVCSPVFPVFSNVDACTYPADPAQIRQRMAEHLARPVLFADEIEAMYAQGARIFVELGAGQVLTKLTSQCLRGRPHLAIALDQQDEDGVKQLWRALAQLAAVGIPIRFDELQRAFTPGDEVPPRSKSSTVFHIDGSGYGRPYPPKGGASARPKPNSESAILPPPPDLGSGLHRPMGRSKGLPLTSTDQPRVGGSEQLDALREVQAQISEAQKTSQAAILESLSMTLGSMEALAKEICNASTLPVGAVLHENDEISLYAKPTQSNDKKLETAVPPMPHEVRQAQSSNAAPPIEEMLLEIIAEKTGYPRDVIALDTALETELGIDSIKRVEILSAVQNRIPGLPEIKPGDMGSLRTVREIAAFLYSSSGQVGPPPSSTPQILDKEPEKVQGRMPARETKDFERQLLEIVAEKTGYPIDVLDIDTDLEAGLGIDSIKRVEIFSATRQRLPELPEVTPQEMGSLRTLREIIAFLRNEKSAAADHEPRATAPTSPVPSKNIVRLQVTATASSRPGLPVANLFDCGPISVTDDGNGTAHAVVQRLQRLGIEGRLVEAVEGGGAGVIFLGGLRTFHDVRDPLRVNAEVFQTAQELIMRRVQPSLFVTVQDTGGDFGLSGRTGLAVWAAGIGGVAKTLAKESPATSVKSIDLERAGRTADAQAEAIIEELLTGGPSMEVGLRADGQRNTIGLQPNKAEFDFSRIDSRSVVIGSGGGRGVTAACLLELARSTRSRIALIGRTTLDEEPENCRGASDETALKTVLVQRHGSSGRPDLAEISHKVAHILAVREIRGTLRLLEKAGSSALYIAADIRDATAVAEALKAIRKQFGPITAIVHGAGVLADKNIADKQPSQFQRVFDTKVEGLQNLLCATAADPVDTLCLFSSVAARFGNQGQCDYAAANEVLNKVATAEARRRGSRCLVKSINWGPWDGGMVTPALATHLRARGTGLLSVAAASRAFVDELQMLPSEGVEILIAADEAMAPDSSTMADRQLAIRVSRETYPILDSHRIKGLPVVPVVLALEWFHRIAECRHPGFTVSKCTDLRVLRGIPLPNFDTGGQRLYLGARDVSNGAQRTLQCELRSGENEIHYSATIEMEVRSAQGEGNSLPSAVERPSWPEPAPNLYDGSLFHGPHFQVIRDLLELDAAGARAMVATTRMMRWQSGPWRTEAAALDGALQLIRVWGRKTLGSLSLPTRVGACIHYSDGAADDLVECIVRCRSLEKLAIVADAELLAADGRPIAKLRDVEMHMIADPETDS